MRSRFERVAALLERSTNGSGGPPVSFALRADDGRERHYGNGTPAFTIVAQRPEGLAALATADLPTIASAYIGGALDLEGEIEPVFLLRKSFRDHHLLRHVWRLARPVLIGRVRSDRSAIAAHYDHEADFFLHFLDTRHRCYSQAVFEREDETLEDAMTRKLDFALDATGAQPGDRILDIGGGWGAMLEHAGRRGIRVTSLTISRESARFMTALRDAQNLPCEVRQEHLFEHRPERPYDAIVNLGVTEHLPDYSGTLQHYDALLKPGGRIYLDASANRAKNSHSTFVERFIFPGDGSLLCLHEYLAAVARTRFRLCGVWNDTRSYEWTSRDWASNLEQNRERIVARWGEPLYRVFRLYLWGCADAFRRDFAEAYRVVLERPA